MSEGPKPRERVARDDVLPHPVSLDTDQLAPNSKFHHLSPHGRKLHQPKPPKVLSIKNIKTNYRTNSPQYRFYEQWDDRGRYLSNQFDSKIQKSIRDVAEKQSAGRYYAMQVDDGRDHTKESKYNEMRRKRSKFDAQKGSSPLPRQPRDPKKMQAPGKEREKSGKQIQAVDQNPDQESDEFYEMPLFPLDVEKDVLDDFTTVLIGRRRSGKTWAQRWLLYHLRHRYPFGIVITGTRLNNFWAQYVPTEFIHDIEDIKEVLDECMARQTYLEAQPELGIDSRMFVILDDVLSDKQRIRYSVALSNLWTNGRHLKIAVFITLQDAKGIGPDLRENTDLCIIFRVYEGGRKKVIYEEWLSYFKIQYCPAFFWKHTGMLNPETGERFEEDGKTTDKDRAKMIPQAIAVLQAKNTDNLQAVFKKVVAEDPGPFALGNPAYYAAAASGNYKQIEGTDRRYRKMRGPNKKHPAKKNNNSKKRKQVTKKKDFSSSHSSSSSSD